MKTKPIFSIVIPVVKTCYFNAAFASALAQHGAKNEIVVVNNKADGDISFVQEHECVRYVENETRLPPSANWNKGLELASGEFVVVLSDDDLLLPNFVEECVKFSKKHKDLDVFRVLREDFDENGSLGTTKGGGEIETVCDYFCHQIEDKRGQCLVDFVVRREAALKVGGFKEYPRAWCPDWLIVLKTGALKNKIGNLNKVLTRYRSNETSISNQRDETFSIDILSASQEFVQDARAILQNVDGIGGKNDAGGRNAKRAEHFLRCFLRRAQNGAYSSALRNGGLGSLFALFLHPTLFAKPKIYKLYSLQRALGRGVERFVRRMVGRKK
jgi:glycosyltransferase involved in cell wall biosynthesis